MASSSAQDVQAAAEVLEALQNTMASAARAIGFTDGLKGDVTASGAGGLVYVANEASFAGIKNDESQEDYFYYSTQNADGKYIVHNEQKAVVWMRLLRRWMKENERHIRDLGYFGVPHGEFCDRADVYVSRRRIGV